MKQLRLWWWGGLLGLCLLALGLRGAPTATAAGPVTFTVTVASAYLRNAPSPSATPTFSAFQGQTYNVTGRTADSVWVSLDAAGATGGTWIRASFGTVNGDLQFVPVTSQFSSGAPVTTPVPQTNTGGGSSGSSGAAGIVGTRLKFTLTAKSSYVRAAPDYTSQRLASLFSGEVMTAVARDPFGNWVQVLYGGGSNLGWLPLGAGKLEGDVMSLPYSDGSNQAVTGGGTGSGGASTPAAPGATGTPANTHRVGSILVPNVPLDKTPEGPFPAWVPAISAHMAAVYHAAASNHRDPNMFAVVGDCNSEEWLYQGIVAIGNWDYVNHPYLASTVIKFGNSFVRDSVAVSGGMSTNSVLDPGLANPKQCQAGESPFACELRVTQASIVFIALGTGDHFTYERFESNYRRLIEYALNIGVLPVLRTKADSLETQEAGAPQGYINDVIRRLGAEYDVPVLDFDLATRTMPNHGLLDEPGNDFHVSGQAVGEHVQSTLQTLYAITHAP